MLPRAVESYLSVRRAAGFRLKNAGLRLKSFAAYSDLQGQHYVNSKTAIEWARQASSSHQRARRLGDVARLARFLHAEDARHEIPPAIFGSESRPRPTLYILGDEQIREIVRLAAQSGYRTLRRQTYNTLFALLSCTGLRVSEAIRLRYADITPDGLMIRATKFNRRKQCQNSCAASRALRSACCGRCRMTALAFFHERLTVERRASVNTCDSYAYAFKLLLDYASNHLKIAPSRLELEQLDAPLVLGFLHHLETARSNGASSRNVRLAAIKSFMHFMEYRLPSALEQIQRILAIPMKKTDTRLVLLC